jgi:hypothetical protein
MSEACGRERVIRRQDRIEVDLECLMCGRLLGEVFGLWWRDTPGQRTARSIANLRPFVPPTLAPRVCR